MPWYAPELEPILAIALATLNADGTLIEANAGFLRIIQTEGRQPIGAAAGQFFRQPDFAALVGAPIGDDGEIHSGLLTLGDFMGRTRSLRGRVWRSDGELRLLAEYDIEELEHLCDTALELNQEYANTQLQLAQANIKLQQREAQIVQLSLTDALTGVGNRRRLDQALALETSRAERTGDKLCAFMADLDHFKKINDTYGHNSGDKVLAEFGKLLRR